MAKEPKVKVEYGEIGGTGLKRQSGRIQEAYLPELQGDKGRKIRKRMVQTDALIHSIFFAIEQVIRGAQWGTEPQGDSSVDVEAAEFLERCMGDMNVSWPAFISEVSSMLQHGWSYFEHVWKKRDGEQLDVPGAPPTSKYNDGLVGVRKLAIRAQDTLFRWDFDEHGGLRGMWQAAPPTYAPKLIPITRSLLFRTKVWKGNPEGYPILDSAYRAWYLKQHIEEIEGIGIERDLAGLPMVRLPQEIFNDSDKASVLTDWENLIKNIRRDEQEGLLVPHDPNNPDMFKVELLSTGGRRAFDTTKIIERYDSRIAQTVLADFVLLGHQETGSYALVKGKREMFEQAIIGWLDAIKGVLNSHLVSRLFRINRPHFVGLEAYPEITYTMPKVPSLEEIANIIKALGAAGSDVFPNTELTNAILEQAGLPPVLEEEMEKASAGLDWQPL